MLSKVQSEIRIRLDFMRREPSEHPVKTSGTIRRHIDRVQGMKKAIMATYYHMVSTDENPRHPEGEDSWCKWQKRTALGMEHEPHPTSLHPHIQKEILPIYSDLSRDDLLERFLGGHTKNSNESFNSTIWRLAPKHLHFGLKIVEFASSLAMGLFTEEILPF
ncbi:uncharacterized protein TNIN_124051 [Trichonephila inaurata madagascariensis]|uniref:Uncharacterized protein n=1 Tax=Trichonephila inaurata madagascariensis TaxID=2747483 RepID=A0A8X6XJJ6_9ARAC|nr:uncharacterized protein TNIN_124051 [Trichonephila inaurata madagascariensis]